ncbi:MAG: glycosyltransferase family 39 protein [Candidatus Saccharimonadales bacterium]
MNNIFRLFYRHRESPWIQLVDWGIIVVCILIFTYLTLPNVVTASAYFDEGYSAYLANLDLWSMAKYTALDVHPPLYYAVLHFWQMLFGNGVAELRLLSIVFGWLAIIFGFLIVRRGFGYRSAWLATLLLSMSPLLIRYGASMRMYTMALAIGLAATYVLVIALASKKRWPWIVYAILVSAGMWTNYFTALIWVTHLIWLLYEYREKRSVIKKWVIAVTGAVVLYLPWLPALIYRAGEIQVSGFWIKPLSIDTLVSTVTMSLTFRNSSQVTGWLVVGVIGLIIALVIMGRQVYSNLNKSKKTYFRLTIALSSLPIILLALMSLPPLRPAYVFRYIIFASIASSILIAIIVTYAEFKRHNLVKRFLLYALTIFIFVTGSYHAMVVGNRNLDTDSQNKLAQVIHDVNQSKHKAPIVVRSPYTYYASAPYATKDFPIHFLFYSNLANIGSTRPLFDHPQNSVLSSATFDKVWLVGEDRGSVIKPPSDKWKLVDYKIEYDDIKNKAIAFAYYFERIK